MSAFQYGRVVVRGLATLLSVMLSVASGLGVTLTPLVAARPAFADGASAIGLIHRCKPNDTYDLVARRYYGRRFFARHLRDFNRRAELKSGIQIMIPTLRSVKADRDASVREFAIQYLQDAERAEYLKLLNSLSSDVIKKGQRLLVGQSLRHVVKKRQTFESIANEYYRRVNARRIRLLRLYNKMPDDNVRPGQVLRIPLDAPAFRADRVAQRRRSPAAEEPPPGRPAPDPATIVAASARRGPKKPPPPPPPPPRRAVRETAAAESALRRVRRQIADGDFGGGLATATGALDAYRLAAVDRRVELLSLRATALIALERRAEAKATFQTLRRLDPTYQLDLYRTSPKVLEVFQSVETGAD